MKQEPCAFVPTKAAAGELLKVARELRLMVDGKIQPVLPDGTRVISNPMAGNQTFSVHVNAGDRKLTIPPLYVDFFNWFFIPAQTFERMPTTGSHWLRMVITATFDITKALAQSYPPEASVSQPTFEWWEEEDTIPLTDPYPPVSTSTDYYVYLVRVEYGRVTETRASRFIASGPNESINL